MSKALYTWTVFDIGKETRGGREKTMEKRRLDYLDLTKGIGIILVVVAHSTFTSEAVQAYITAFHMPLFFIISGMLICLTGEESKKFGSLVKKKARTILVPYVTFSAAYVILDIASLYFKPGKLTWIDIERSGIEFATLYGISVLWFMTALFFGELMFLGWKNKCNKWKYGDAVMITSGIISAAIMTLVSPLFQEYYPLYRSMPILWVGYYITVLLRSLGAFSFLVMGYYSYRFLFEKIDNRRNYNIGYLNKSENRADKKGSPKWIRELRQGFSWKETACGILCLLLLGAVSQVNGVVDLHFLVFANPLLYYLGAASGTFGVMLLCRQLGRCRPLRYLGVNSLIIMATHLDFRVLITAINYANWLNQYITRAKVYMLYLNVAFMMTLIEIIIIYVINHWLPFMIGKKSRRGLKLWKPM